MAIINLILQGKGGVGKTFVASLMAQFLKEQDTPTYCFDSDPVNASFAAYQGLAVELVDIMDGDSINTRRFDSLIEKLVELPGDCQAIIDNGASTFIPLGSYIAENNVPDLLKEYGHELRLHTVVTGGQAEGDTLQGLQTLLSTFDNKITVWENPFFGNIDFASSDLFKTNKSRFERLIQIPKHKKETYGADIEMMLAKKLTFAEAVNGEHAFNLMARQRIKIAHKELFSLLELAGL
ncbi:nucleotide-binding protein [Desulfotalea psychrophila]|uniref:Probable conjugal transfer protein TraL n=1 Tax=Desulfotalea psychrophila (strain LSv54 / DSM 12343) TaxID=177439 RepID=Q6AIH3_DESPS|nr:conjugal transfer protein TraL [Desulfotalea psychrophila]CAG37874.1 probable conjugal transfer protein TraL [Desulfotalea psychrophila LSv54]